MDNTPDTLVARNEAAIAKVTALCPANTTEASQAVQYVAASANALDCLRLANDPDIDPELRLRNGKQAASMMRQANSAMRIFLLMQAAREKRDAHAERAEAAAAARLVAETHMADAPTPPPRAPTPVRPQVLIPPRKRGDPVVFNPFSYRSDEEIQNLSDAEIEQTIAAIRPLAARELAKFEK